MVRFIIVSKFFGPVNINCWACTTNAKSPLLRVEVQARFLEDLMALGQAAEIRRNFRPLVVGSAFPEALAAIVRRGEVQSRVPLLEWAPAFGGVAAAAATGLRLTNYYKRSRSNRNLAAKPG